jgi:DNA-binding CsgD family transcriptional regulator
MIGARMLQGPFLSVMETSTVDEFRNVVVRFANSLGFDIVSAMAVVDHSVTSTEFHLVDNMPAAYVDGFGNAELQRADPVMQHCKHTSVPILWDQATYLADGSESLWEEQALHGLKTGVALAMHFPGDRHFFIGVDRRRPLPRRVKRLTSIVAELQLFAVHAQDAAFRIFAPPAPEVGGSPSLTPREIEALRWTMDGKTAAEVGEALRISERTAVFHLQNAVKKLGCLGKHQAVLKAIRLRLFV